VVTSTPVARAASTASSQARISLPAVLLMWAMCSGALDDAARASAACKPPVAPPRWANTSAPCADAARKIAASSSAVAPGV
jgi:hypothetical protein